MFYFDNEKDKRRSSGMEVTCYNNRCIKARLEDTGKDAICALGSIFRKVNRHDLVSDADLKFLASIITNYDRIKDSYSSKAQVNLKDGDTFDLTTGKNLAKSRLLNSYHKDFDAQICKALTTLRTYVAGVEHYCTKHKIDTSKVSSVEEIKDKIYNSGYKTTKNK